MAKAKTKNMSITNWEKMVIDKTETHTFEANGEEFEISITPTLSWEAAGSMVEYVLQIVFNEETGDYHPEVKEVMIRAEVLENYAHFNIPKSFDKIYYLVYATEAYEIVEQLINQTQLEHIRKAIDEGIDYRLNVLSGGIQAEINKIMESFNEFNNNAENMFSKFKDDDLSNFVKNVADIKEPLDEKKIVELVHAANKEE